MSILVLNISHPESLGLALISELRPMCDKLNVTLVDKVVAREQYKQISAILLVALGDIHKQGDVLQQITLHTYCHTALAEIPVCVTVDREEYCQESSTGNNKRITWTVLNNSIHCNSSYFADLSDIHRIGYTRGNHDTSLLEIPGSNNILADNKATTRIAKILSRLSQELDVSCSGRLGFPTKAMIEISRDCNLRCELCPLGANRIDRLPPMPFYLYRRIIDTIAPTIWKAKLYNYGEPLLHPEVGRFIRYGKAAGIEHIEIATNGMLLSPPTRASLLTSGLNMLKVSIDGFDQKSYSQYRKNGEIKQILANVTAMRKERDAVGYNHPIIEIQCLATRDTEMHIHEMRTMALEAGADRFRLKTFNALMAGSEMATLGRTFLPKNRSLSRYENYDLLAYRDRYKLPTCRWPFDRIVISANGVVVPCCYDFAGQYPFANFQNNSYEWWWTPRRSYFVDSIQQNPSCFDICKNCPTGVPDLAVAGKLEEEE